MSSEDEDCKFSFFAPLLGREANDTLILIEELFEKRAKNSLVHTYFYCHYKIVQCVFGYQWRIIKPALFAACFTLAKPNKSDGTWRERYEWQITYGKAIAWAMPLCILYLLPAPEGVKFQGPDYSTRIIFDLLIISYFTGETALIRKEILPLALFTVASTVILAWTFLSMLLLLGAEGLDYIAHYQLADIIARFILCRIYIALFLLSLIAGVVYIIVEQILFRLRTASQ